MTFTALDRLGRYTGLMLRTLEGFMLRRRIFNKDIPLPARRDRKGRVYIVGAGPGDAELLTVKALKLLQEADVVLFDSLVDPSVLAVIPRRVQKEFVGKRSGKHSMPQHRISERLLALAAAGHTVVRLKGGDPAIFARTCEETAVLTANNVPFAIVPGITAASGASAYTGIPLTDRSCAQSVRLMTAHLQDPDQEPDWQQICQTMQKETVVMYMGLKRLRRITQRLIKGGVPLDLPVAVVENACCENQLLITSSVQHIADTVDEAKLEGPALLIFGNVVKSRQQVNTELLQTDTYVATV